MSKDVLITPVYSDDIIAKPDKGKESSPKALSKGTCGYDSRYGGGFSSKSAGEIRGYKQTFGDTKDQKQQAAAEPPKPQEIGENIYAVKVGNTKITAILPPQLTHGFEDEKNTDLTETDNTEVCTEAVAVNAQEEIKKPQEIGENIYAVTVGNTKIKAILPPQLTHDFEDEKNTDLTGTDNKEVCTEVPTADAQEEIKKPQEIGENIYAVTVGNTKIKAILPPQLTHDFENSEEKQEEVCAYADETINEESCGEENIPSAEIEEKADKQELYESAISQNMDYSKTSGYFYFGAGKTVTGNGYQMVVPSAYNVLKKPDYRDMVAFCCDDADKFESSPIVISVESEKVLKINKTVFFKKIKSKAELSGEKYENYTHNGRTAALVSGLLAGGELAVCVFIPMEKIDRLFKIAFKFNTLYNNAESIVYRIFSQFSADRGE